MIRSLYLPHKSKETEFYYYKYPTNILRDGINTENIDCIYSYLEYLRKDRNTEFNKIKKLTVRMHGNNTSNVIFPPKLTHLKLFNFDYIPLDLNLLSNLTTLNIFNCYRFNYYLDLTLIPNLTFLKLNSDYNNPLINFPNNLEFLHIGSGFANKLDILPSKLTTLDFNYNYYIDINQIQLPNSLTELVLPSIFNQDINCILHLTKLTSLNFGRNFDKPINNNISPLSNLSSLYLGYHFDQEIDLTSLPNLTYLDTGWTFNQTIDNKLPLNLVEIWFGNNFNQPINELSKLSKLKMLNIGKNFNQSINFELPKSLKKITCI